MKQLKTVRDAITSGAKIIYLNNGTEIEHLDHGQTYDAISPPKMIKGKPVYRQITCRITCPRGEGIKHKEIILPYSLSYFAIGYNYIIPERELNLFINLNGGIDSYRTDLYNAGWFFYFPS